MDKIGIIIVNYNNPTDTIEAINSVIKAERENYQIAVCVVDNGSTDNSVELLSNEFANYDDVILLNAEMNNGFSAGNNIGIKYALDIECNYIMLLNNDTIIHPKLISSLFNAIDENIVAVPKILYFGLPDTIWYAGGDIDYKTGRANHIGMGKKDSHDYSTAKKVSFASGCCFMIHSSLLLRVGFLDECYFLYWEDVDFSIRLNRIGADILFVPNAILWHKVAASSGTLSKEVVYYGYRNQFYFLKYYRFGASAFLYTYINSLYCFIKGVFFRTNQRIIPRAWLDYKRGVTGKVEL